MSLDPNDERKLRKNWSLLKQELAIEELVARFVEEQIFTPVQRNDILNVIPNTASMRGEKFLNAVIACGNRGYRALCVFLLENTDNRYNRVIEALGIDRNVARGDNAASDSRPSTALSSASSGTVNSETGERNRRVRVVVTNESHQHPTSSQPLIAVVAPAVTKTVDVPIASSAPNTFANEAPSPSGATGFGMTSRQSWSVRTASQDSPQPPHTVPTRVINSTSQRVGPSQQDATQPLPTVSTRVVNSTSQRAGPSQSSRGGGGADVAVDMQSLEQELVRMAPTIADLFQKIAKQTGNIPTSEEEIRKVKDENERLRKTNKSLIEKLNTFQQKIIQLQLDNKRLKETGDIGRVKKEEIKQKAHELHDLERRLDEHKRALEEKELELTIQLAKLKEIQEENEEQKIKIEKLEELQDDGILERNIQQEQISSLVEEKEKQKDQIENLEEHHKLGEQRLYRLEERLKLLEQPPRRQQQNRMRRVSPPRNNTSTNTSTNYWMNGVVERSHHANVKFQSDWNPNPDLREGKLASKKQGWPFI